MVERKVCFILDIGTTLGNNYEPIIWETLICTLIICHFYPGDRILETAQRHKEIQIILEVLFLNKIKFSTLNTLLTITFCVL